MLRLGKINQKIEKGTNFEKLKHIEAQRKKKNSVKPGTLPPVFCLLLQSMSI